MTKNKFRYHNESDGSIPSFQGQLELDGTVHEMEAQAFGAVVWVTIAGTRHPNFNDAEDELLPGHRPGLDRRIWARLLEIVEPHLKGLPADKAVVLEYDDTQDDFGPAIIHLACSLERLGI